MSSFYDIEINDLAGNPINLADFKFKKILIVNVASKCGFTPQYSQLQELHENFKDELQIIGVPCNDFGWQEPGDADDIATFCRVNYGVDFLITQKVKILLAPHQLYKWLCNKKHNGVSNHLVKWNFSKFLIDENGKLDGFYGSSTQPLDDKILNWVKAEQVS